MGIISGLIAVGGVLFGLVACLGNRMWHRHHLAGCVDDLQRHSRLRARLAGCVADMEHLLDQVAPQSTPTCIPEELVGHVAYLYALRREAADTAARLDRHSARVRWPDVYPSKATVAGRRCPIAHRALASAYRTFSETCRAFEQGLPQALAGDGARSRTSTLPVRLLTGEMATQVSQLREDCEQALETAADALNLPFRWMRIFDCRWPVWRSEMAAGTEGSYNGEVRPMSWAGFGPQPLVHVDAR